MSRMSNDECVVCMLPSEECGPFTTENYCPLIIHKGEPDPTVKPHKICVLCRDTIEQKYGGEKIPPYTKNSKNLTCFGCGCRVGDLPIREEVAITINPDERIVSGILWKIFEGIYLVFPIIILSIFYARLIDYLNCYFDLNQKGKCYFIRENIDAGFYFIGFILSIITTVGFCTCCVIYRADRDRNITRARYQ